MQNRGTGKSADWANPPGGQANPPQTDLAVVGSYLSTEEAMETTDWPAVDVASGVSP
jgi:hypothetical protein